MADPSEVAAASRSAGITPSPAPLRIAGVVAKVALLGVGAGAFAGVVSVTLWALSFSRADLSALPSAWIVVGVLGGALGLVLLPLAGFTALRNLPLWKVLLGTTLTTAISGVIGAQFFSSSWLLWPVGGFIVAVIGLWVHARMTGKHRPVTPAL